MALKAGDLVERVLDLNLGPIKQGKVHVKFKGVRLWKYSNVEPTVIEVGRAGKQLKQGCTNGGQ